MRFAVKSVAAGAVLLLGATGGMHSAGAFDQTHAALDSLLARHVVAGWVDYRSLQSDRPQLQAYLRTLGDLPEKEFGAFTPAQQLALLINAYNVFTLELVLDRYPLKSIRDVPGAWDGLRWRLLGKQVTLNDIEHERIRKRFDDARVHCALVCASRGCPRLLAAAYRGDRLDAQLDHASQIYVRDAAVNRLDRKARVLRVSKIFEWYRHDFVARWGETAVPPGSERSGAHRSIIGFFRDYLPAEDADYLGDHPVKIEYNDYDWGLNDRRSD